MTDKTRVLIIDNHPLFRRGVSQFGVRDRVQLLVRLAQIQAHEALAS